MTSLAGQFEAHRTYLFGLAYRMLGSSADAEDVLQEAFLRAGRVDEEARSPRAMLTTIVTRLCLDQLKSARVQREEYVGPWLPDPVMTELADVEKPDDRISAAESVTMAFLLVLETLSPLERAVFLLHEVFGFEFSEVAAALDRTEAATRQLFHRAREHLRSRRPRFRPSSGAALELAMKFFSAAAIGDASEVARLMSPDVVATSDSGGKAQAARRSVVGADDVTRFIIGLMKRATDREVESAILNGQPAAVVRHEGRIESVLILECGSGAIHAIRIVRNPDKLEQIRPLFPSPAIR